MSCFWMIDDTEFLYSLIYKTLFEEIDFVHVRGSQKKLETYEDQINFLTERVFNAILER